MCGNDMNYRKLAINSKNERGKWACSAIKFSCGHCLFASAVDFFVCPEREHYMIYSGKCTQQTKSPGEKLKEESPRGVACC